MATTAKAQEKLEEEISARRNDAQRRASRWLYWQELLTSLWAPFTCFALALVLYIILVEYHTPAYHWAQPILKSFGLLMIGWFVGLWLFRLLFNRFRQLRKLRHEARELAQELQTAMNSPAQKLEPKLRERLVEQAAIVDAERIEGQTERLESELKKLSSLADKHLTGWRHGSTLELVVGFLKALAIALLIRTIVIEPFKIPSGSMYPTLQIGDQIFVNKFIYGVRIPWMNRVPFVIVRPPERGDVIVFNNPLDESKDFIKRVVALPGDRVELIDEVVYINGVAQPRRLVSANHVYYTQDQDPSAAWREEHVELDEENLGGKPHLVFQGPPRSRLRLHEGPWVVPPAHLFVMGDNRDNSADSRLGFGVTRQIAFVPYGNIKGKAMVIWLSLSYDGLFSSLFGGTGLRTDRLFLPIR